MRFSRISGSESLINIRDRAQRIVTAAVAVGEWVWQKVTNTEDGANFFVRGLQGSALAVMVAYLLSGGDKKIYAIVGGLGLLGVFEVGRKGVLHIINNRDRPDNS